MNQTLDYNEVFAFMETFQIDFINRYNELIIDHSTNTYVSLNGCEDIEEVRARVVFTLCRPIGKGLEDRDATKLLKRLNKYFNTELTREDMRLMYGQLCYAHKMDQFKDFIERGFPVDELIKEEQYN